jgi:small subunit ribosomal protein S5
MPTVIKNLDAGAYQLKDQVVAINRVTKVVKGGKNLSFAALVVVGDPSAAVVGYGSGKARRKYRRPSAKELSRRRRT